MLPSMYTDSPNPPSAGPDAPFVAPGIRKDIVEAIYAVLDTQEQTLTARRVEALASFLDTDDGRNLLAGYKRASGIVSSEEETDHRHYHGKPDPQLYLRKEERELAVAITVAKHEAEAAIARDDFEQAIHAIATLRPFVDAFFEKVTVNVEMSDRRENRLKLLNEFREATRAVADFSRIEGSAYRSFSSPFSARNSASGP